MRSPSLTIPRGEPASSMTGTALILCSRRVFAISLIGVSHLTATTAAFIISRIFIELCSIRVRYLQALPDQDKRSIAEIRCNDKTELSAHLQHRFVLAHDLAD